MKSFFATMALVCAPLFVYATAHAGQELRQAPESDHPMWYTVQVGHPELSTLAWSEAIRLGNVPEVEPALAGEIINSGDIDCPE